MQWDQCGACLGRDLAGPREVVHDLVPAQSESLNSSDCWAAPAQRIIIDVVRLQRPLQSISCQCTPIGAVCAGGCTMDVMTHLEVEAMRLLGVLKSHEADRGENRIQCRYTRCCLVFDPSTSLQRINTHQQSVSLQVVTLRARRKSTYPPFMTNTRWLSLRLQYTRNQSRQRWQLNCSNPEFTLKTHPLRFRNSASCSSPSLLPFFGFAEPDLLFIDGNLLIVSLVLRPRPIFPLSFFNKKAAV